MNRLKKYEKETIISTSEGDDNYQVYTFNPGLKRKLNAYARRNPAFCQLKKVTSYGSALFVIHKARLSLRLTEPYSEVRRKAAREKARQMGLGKKQSET